MKLVFVLNGKTVTAIEGLSDIIVSGDTLCYTDEEGYESTVTKGKADIYVVDDEVNHDDVAEIKAHDRRSDFIRRTDREEIESLKAENMSLKMALIELDMTMTMEGLK